jgi:hypothetical protein
MQTTPEVDKINELLERDYGKFDNALPMYRVVWSHDQYEHRYGTYKDFTESGIYIRTVSEVREVPKYRSYMSPQYVLEKCCPVPPDCDLDQKVSYEPLFGFRGLPVIYDICKIVIDSILEKMHMSKYPKYTEDELEGNSLQAQNYRAEKIAKEFDHDERITLALGTGSAVFIDKEKSDVV